jgi:hypothetical protein
MRTNKQFGSSVYHMSGEIICKKNYLRAVIIGENSDKTVLINMLMWLQSYNGSSERFECD